MDGVVVNVDAYREALQEGLRPLRDCYVSQELSANARAAAGRLCRSVEISPEMTTSAAGIATQCLFQ